MIGALRQKIYRLLRRGERYTGTDNVYLAKGGFLFSVAQFCASLSSLGLAMLFARLVSKDAYGTYQYLLSWGSIVTLASLTGMTDALTRAVAQGHDRTIHAVMTTRLKWGLGGFAVAAAVGGYYLSRGRLDLFAGLLLVGALFPLQSTLSAWADYLIGKKRFDLQSRYSVTLSLAAAVAMAAAIVIFPQTLPLLIVFCLTYVIGNALCLRAAMRKLPPQGDVASDAIDYGKKLTLIDTLASIGTYADRVVIFTLLGARETAIYTFAIAPPEQIKGYLKNLYSLALPKVVDRPLADIRKSFWKKYLAGIAVIAGIIISYILVAPFAYRLLFPAYQESVALSRWFSISLIAAIGALPSAVITGHRRVRDNAYFQLFSAIISVTLLIVFVKTWGLAGAIAARVITRYMSLAFLTGLVERAFNERTGTPAGTSAA